MVERRTLAWILLLVEHVASLLSIIYNDLLVDFVHVTSFVGINMKSPPLCFYFVVAYVYICEILSSMFFPFY